MDGIRGRPEEAAGVQEESAAELEDEGIPFYGTGKRSRTLAVGSRLGDEARAAMRLRRLSPSTERSYVNWMCQFYEFHSRNDPAKLGAVEVAEFLTHLATRRRVAASTQNQALAALLFLYRYVLRKDLGELDGVIRAKRPTRLPVVLSRHEVRSVLEHLSGERWLMASMMYGSGLRVSECMRLRVQDLDFERKEVLIRDGKGAKDRVTTLAASLEDSVKKHLVRAREIHSRDLSEGWGRVALPGALHEKYPNAPTEWRWQWVFPQERRWRDEVTGREGRHHADPSIIQKAFKRAVADAGIVKRATCHSLRHSFATHLLQAGNDIRTVQELLGHKDVRVTMRYLHVLNVGGLGVRSPIDSL